MQKIYVVCVVAVSLLVGCGKSDPLNRHAVSGKVTLEGAPLAAGTITFEPKEGGTMSGTTVAQGAYSIPAENGLSPGEYLVRLSSAGDELAAAEEAPGESNRLAVELIPPEFGSESVQFVKIFDGEVNEINLDVPERRKPKKK